MTGVPIRIMMVDDDAADVLLTRKALERGRVTNEIIVAEHGAQALAMLRKEPPYGDVPMPDVIMLDLNMPVMDGFETLEAIRADPELSHLPVLILTTSDADEDVLKSYKLTASCYLAKPVGVDEFLKLVASIENFWLQAVRLPPRR